MYAGAWRGRGARVYACACAVSQGLSVDMGAIDMRAYSGLLHAVAVLLLLGYLRAF